ncbi:MAG: insulinase family protein, partial [Oscillospiraceae bacterium]|nr:insulinase family protein [Oscillospiraceae bacterium]
MKSTRELEELDAKFHELEHEKSGARLVWLERDEENKTFGIAFQTQPWDDPGVFHILEHSVLCGSERFPVKEPFVELLKSSLNTFLNAMTFPDKTFYPVSSRNGQDFLNLMRVYMDAVLHPLIHSKPEIFGQEGWHYELSEDGTASYKGVVFNEMKGAFASPDTLLEGEMNRRLFPDTCYRYVSGGDPVHIPELTYESFAAAHKRLYHPSNAYIFLDGRMDIDQVLAILDGEYLSAYDRAPVPGPIGMQPPVDGGTAELTYELSHQEGLEGRARLAQGFVACTYADRVEQVALRALADALCGDNQAPLKRRLLEAGLAKDVLLSLRDGVQQPWMLLEARDIDADKLDEVSAALRDELETLAQEGLDHARILATLDNLEFQLRERDYGSMPQGLVFGFNVLESWLYGGDPAANLTVGTLFDELRARCEAGWFEKLLARVLLDNPHTCRVIMRPSHTIGQERQEQEAARLRTAQSAWSGAEAAVLRERQAKIETWQNTPDTPEQLATIPMLRLDQIPEKPEELPCREEELSGVKVLRHEVPT